MVAVGVAVLSGWVLEDGDDGGVRLGWACILAAVACVLYAASPGRGSGAVLRVVGAPLRAARHGLGRALLPEGYPGSVAPDYLEFQAWDTLQGVCSYVRGVLTSRTMLVAAGVGDAAASAVGAAATFALRDAAANAGGFLFAIGMGKNCDGYPQRWRLAADAANDAALALELAVPSLIGRFGPAAFPACAVASAVLRSLVGVAGRSSWAALTQHFAISGNHADLAAKEGTQETLASLVGMAIGWACTARLSGEEPPAGDPGQGGEGHAALGSVSNAELTLFISLTVLHMYANWRAVSCVVLNTLNRPRAAVVALHFVRSGGDILTPAEAHVWRPRDAWDSRALARVRASALGATAAGLTRLGGAVRSAAVGFHSLKDKVMPEVHAAEAPGGRIHVFMDSEEAARRPDYAVDCLCAAAWMALELERETDPDCTGGWGPGVLRQKTLDTSRECVGSLAACIAESGAWDTRRITLGLASPSEGATVDVLMALLRTASPPDPR